jgi:hypothetical protein
MKTTCAISEWGCSDRIPSAPAHQGQIYDTATGRTVALTYDDDTGERTRLIAAAPDLLAALVEAEAVIRWAAQEAKGRVKAEMVGGWLHHADSARAAIAKATGKS